jgi:hypothetical protein
MIWVVGIEVQIITCISRLPVHFRGQFRTSLHDQDRQERKSVISLNSHCEFDESLRLLRWRRNRRSLASPCGQTMKVSLTYLSHLAGLWSAVSNAISSKCFRNVLLSTGDNVSHCYTVFLLPGFILRLEVRGC